MPLDKFLRPVASDTRPRQSKQVLDGVVPANRPLQRLEAEELMGLVVDISKSTDRAPWCIGATPFVLPRPSLQRRRQHCVLDARATAAF